MPEAAGRASRNVGGAFDRAKRAAAEDPLMTRILLRVAVFPIDPAHKAEGEKTLALVNELGSDYFKKVTLPLALPGGVGELFAFRLAEAAGVRVAPVTLSETKPDNFNDFVKKVHGGWCVSERVQKSIPMFFIKEQAELYPTWFDFQKTATTEKLCIADFGFLLGNLDIRCIINKESPVSRAAYTDFPDLAPKAAIEAAKWDSDERLLTYAFRSFLYATFPHTSNCLVSTDGKLTLIDHEKVLYSLDDISLLKASVSPIRKTHRVAKALRQMCDITETDIRAALSDIPSRFWKFSGVFFSDEQKAANYFIKRLDKWRRCFG